MSRSVKDPNQRWQRRVVDVSGAAAIAMVVSCLDNSVIESGPTSRDGGAPDSTMEANGRSTNGNGFDHERSQRSGSGARLCRQSEHIMRYHTMMSNEQRWNHTRHVERLTGNHTDWWQKGLADNRDYGWP